MVHHESDYRILYRDVDSMGYLYYARYLELFELGRVDWMRLEGFRYRDMEDQLGLGLPVTQATCRYKMPLRYDDMAVIQTQVVGWSSSTISFGCEVRVKGEDSLRASGEVELGCIDLKTGRPGRIPEGLLELLETKLADKKGRPNRL